MSFIDRMTEPRVLEPAAALTRLHRLLATALVVIGVVSIGALIAVWLRLEAVPLQAQTINLVGRQRLLAMRVVEGVTRLADTHSPAANARGELSAALRQLTTVHARLASPQGPLKQSPATLPYLARATEPLRVLERVAQRALAAPPSGDAQLAHELIRLRAAAHAWVSEMDDLNDVLVSQRAERDTLYIHLPLLLGALIILTLALTWRGLHQPAIRLMTRTLRELDAERALRERLALVASSTTNAVLITDRDGRVEWTNDAFLRLTGYTLDDMRASGALSRMHGPETDPVVVARMRDASARGEGYLERIAHYAKDGARHWVVVDCQPLRDSTGQLSGFVSVYSEFTALFELERELMKQAERYSVAMNAAEMGVWDWDIRTGALEHDTHQYKLFGVDPASHDPTDNDWRQRVLPEDLPGLEQSLKRALQGDGQYSAQFRIRRGDGTLRWLQGTGIVIRDANGQPVRMVGVNLDVHARYIAEQQRHELDLRLRKLADNLPGILYQFRLRPDGSSMFPYASAGIQTMFDVTPDMLNNDAAAVFNAIHPDDAPRIHSAVRDSARTLEVFNQDFRVILKSGELRWLRAHATPNQEPDGSTLWFGVILDSSVIKEAERREREATASLEAAQALARVGSWSFDVATGKVEWSRQMYELYGRDPALGPPIYTGTPSPLYVDEDAAWLTAATQRAIHDGRPYSGMLRLRTPHAGIAILRAEAKVTCDAHSQATRIFGTLMDMTESVERERALQQAHVAAEAASRAKSEFLANMSHEIRTPMAAVLGYVDLLGDPNLSRAQLREFTTTIQRNAKHLLELINQVLDLSKIEAGEMIVERIACSPAAISREIVSLLRPRAEEKNLSLSLHFDGPIPATVQSDPTRLRQILLNLVGNAIKFTPSGEVALTVTLDRDVVRPPQLQLQVKDTGIGIEPTQLSHLFRPFSQADGSTTRRFGGTGLGLSIASHLTGLLGGDIKVVSAPGVGTTFTASVATGDLQGVELSECRAEAEDEAPPSLEPPGPHGPASLAGIHILLVEDGPDNQRLISHHLTRLGATVEVVSNGQLAVERLLSASLPRFDAVLMDMQMPVLDGYAATAKLRKMGYSGPIIALTAHAMEGDRQKCLQAGCDDYTTKPIDQAQLVSAISSQLRASRPAPAALDTARRLLGTPMLVSTYSDDPDMVELIQQFVASLPDRVAQLRAAFDANDRARLTSLAHQLKGAGGGYGFAQITTAAQRVEAEAESGIDVAGLRPGLNELIDLCLSARAAPPPANVNASAQTTPAGAASSWRARS